MLKIVWTLGDVVRKLREGKGWTQGELGERADIHPTVIGRLENNSDKSERTTIERAAGALGVSIADLYAFAEETSLAAELSDAERRSVMKFQRRLVEKRRAAAPAPAPSRRPDLQVTTRESRKLVQKRQQR